MTNKPLPEPLCLHCIILATIDEYMQQMKEDGHPVASFAHPAQLLAAMTRVSAHILSLIDDPMERKLLALDLFHHVQQLAELHVHNRQQQSQDHPKPRSLDEMKTGTLH